MRPPTQQEEKPQLDGVLPQNHPDVYEALLKETMCITAINEEETIYREKDIPYRRVCDECFWDIALDINNFIEEEIGTRFVRLKNKFRELNVHAIVAEKLY
ncbi:hypothetical protein P5V15_003023 [Pogonomyrmex californicus]